MKNRTLNILILGLGGVGYYLAKRLTHEGHAVTAIESSYDLIQRADGEVDARLIQGNAMSFDCWREANAETMDYMIAVTDNDAVNILASIIADRCGIRRKIARVRSLELWRSNPLISADDLHIDLVIRPEELAAREIVRLLKMSAGNIIIDIAEGQMKVVATRIDDDSILVHRTLMDISKQYSDIDFRIVSVARGINTIIPGGEFEILPQDQVFILARSEEIPKLMELLKISQTKRHRVMIVGGGLIGSRVAELLESSFPIRLVERDERRAVELSHALRRTEILHGDGADADTLDKAGLVNMDTIITATGDNETNIMTSVLAKHLIKQHARSSKVPEGKTIALVQKEEYLVLAATMGSDIVLNKKVLASNEIYKYIRRGTLLSAAHLHGLEAEVHELVALQDAPITKKPLYQVGGMKGKIIIGGIFRNGTWQIAVGNTHVLPGDKIIAVCASAHLNDLQKLIGA